MVEKGQKIVPSDTVFCTWHGLKYAEVWSVDGCYALVRNGVVVAISNDLKDIAKLYVETVWSKD